MGLQFCNNVPGGSLEKDRVIWYLLLQKYRQFSKIVQLYYSCVEVSLKELLYPNKTCTYYNISDTATGLKMKDVLK